MLALVLLLAAAEPAPADGDEALRRRVAAQPAVVRDYFQRRANCNHWGGEEPYDADRRREIDAALKDLRCETIEAEAIFLRRHFAARPETLAVIELADEQTGW